ncbi:MAG: TetR/AcrR family transcriptional regulator [Streptosporangiaceae bacterium]
MTPSITSPTSAPRTRRNNRRGQGGRLREELLAAASALITETGSAQGLSLRSVAARAGVAATSVYLHFADFDALRMAVAQHCFSEFAAARDAAVAGIDDPARALIVRCQAYVQYALDHPGHYRLMYSSDLPQFNPRHPVPGPAADAARDPETTLPSVAALNALADSIQRCQQAGATPDTTSPATLAILTWTCLHGQATLRIDRPYAYWPPLDQTINDLVTRLIRLHPATPM